MAFCDLREEGSTVHCICTFQLSYIASLQMNLSADPLLISLLLRPGEAKKLSNIMTPKFHLDSSFYNPGSKGEDDCLVQLLFVQPFSKRVGMIVSSVCSINSKPQTYPSFLLLAVRKNMQAMKSWGKSGNEVKGKNGDLVQARSIVLVITYNCLSGHSVKYWYIPKCPPENESVLFPLQKSLRSTSSFTSVKHHHLTS